MKFIGFFLILSIFTFSSAIKRNGNSGENIKDLKKVSISKEDSEIWRNPCVADGYATSSSSRVPKAEAYEKLRLIVYTVDEDLKHLHVINTTNYEAFDFLPEISIVLCVFVYFSSLLILLGIFLRNLKL